MAFNNEIRAGKAIWRPYLDSGGERKLNQRSLNNGEVCLEKATFISYYELEDGDRKLLKPRSVETYEREARYVDSSCISSVNTGRYFQFTESCPQSLGDHIWHERYKQTYWQNSSWENHTCIQKESERRNFENLTQNQNEYNSTSAVIDLTNNVNPITNVDFIENDLKSKIYGQMRLENDQMLMDKEILKAYYEQETRYNESGWQKQSEYNLEKERTDIVIQPTKHINSVNDITFIENGVNVTHDGPIELDDNQLSMDKDVLKTYYELEKGNDSCGLNIKKGNHSTHLGIDIPNMVNTVTDVVNIQNDLQLKNDGQWCREDIYRLIRSGNWTQPVQKHSSDKTKAKPLQCKYCKKNIVGKSNLRRHVRTIHEDPFNRPHHCIKCDATFKSNACLKSHMKSHQRIPTFKNTCPECKTGFNNAKNFRLHMRTEKPEIKCNICNLTFKYKGCYELHQKEHVETERCNNSQDDNQKIEEASVREDITTTMNSRPYQDDEVERENITDTNEVSETTRDRNTTKTHPIDSDKTFPEVTQHELNRGNIGSGGLITERDKLMKADLINDVNQLNRKDAVEPETDGEIRNENIHREPSLNNVNESEVRTTLGHVDSACVIDKRELTMGDIYSETGYDTSIDLLDDFDITPNKSSREDCQKSSMDNCTKRSVKEVSSAKVIGEFPKINASNSSPCGAGEQRHEDIKNMLKTVENKDRAKILRENTTNSSRKLFKCGICEKTLSSKSSLKRHQVIHTGQKDYSCNVCGKSFALKHTLKDHLRRHNGERPYKCGQCGKAFSSASLRSCHRLTHSNHRPYKCETCSRTFKHKCHFRAHNKYVHATDKPFKCGVCEARFAWRGAYRYHLKIHTGDNEQPKLQCHICNKLYSGKASLYGHIKLVHEKRHTKPYHCGECDKSFWKKSLLKAHIEQHSRKPTLKYSCAHCNASFKTSHYLRLHMRIHISDVYYKCDICNIAFKSHKCFITHQKNHAA